MNDYTAWLNGTAVAHGPLSYCREFGRDVFLSDLWQQNEGNKATLKITRGARQSFVESIVLHTTKGQP